MSIPGFLLGAVLGSFCLVLADRSLTKQTFWGRSYCLHCKKKLHWYDLFPIFSFVLLKGRCRYCKKKISFAYPVVELITGFLIGFLFWQSFNNFQFSIFNFQFSIFVLDLLLKVFFVIVLVPLFITDLKTMFIPDRIIKPSLLIGFILSLGITVYKISYLYYFLSINSLGKYLLPPYSDYFLRHAFYTAQPFLMSILMTLLIGGFFMGLIIITRGKGMGGGDVKLGAFMGLMLGFPQGLLAIISSFILGAVFSIFLIMTGKKHFGQSIPFGPFLVLGSLIALFWGNQIIEWYLHLSV